MPRAEGTVYDEELWTFLRAIEQDVAVNWHPCSPLAQRLRALQERYDPAEATRTEAHHA